MSEDFKAEFALCLSPEKSSFSPLLFAGDLFKGIKSAATLGYNGIEISIRDSNELDQEELIKKLDEYKMKVFSIATGQSFFTDRYSFSSESKKKRKNAVKRIKGHIDFAHKLNCGLVVGGILGNVREKFGDGTEIERRIIECFRECLEYTKEKNVVIFFEPINFYLTNFICTLDEGSKFIKILGCDNIELIPDTHHMNIEERCMPDSIKKHINLFHYIHFSDSNRQAPGYGNIDYKTIIATLKEKGFSGVISFEILPFPDDLTAARQAISYIKKILELV